MGLPMMDHEGRMAKTRNKLESLGVDGLFITNLSNVRYLTGFSGSNGQVLVTGDGATFLSDPRYQARAKDIVHGAEILIYAPQLKDELPDLIARLGIKRLGIEAASMTIVERDDLQEMLPGVELTPVKEVVESLRRVKEAAEIERIKEAVRLADEAYEWIRGRLVPGAAERDVALDLEVKMRSLGADQVSFEPIVASGHLSAHIHHTASHRSFETGDLVLMDFGARVDGYCSDITRTVVLGPATDEQKAMYEIVLATQAAGIAAVGPGVACVDVDAAARAAMIAAGQEDTFAHGLGHGVGLDIHEAPKFAKISTDILMEGDVVTVEPGMYVTGVGGIRIEDDVVVTTEGAVILNAAPKETLIEI